MTHMVAALALISAGTVLSQSATSTQPFRAAAVTHTGRLDFDGLIAAVFDLFTPEGERHWAKGWDPEIVYPRDRDVGEGMVFHTRDHDTVLTWTVERYEPANYRIAYNVVTPAILVRRIEVRCRPAGPARTEVDVRDSYVALSEPGNQFIEHLTEQNYAAKMATWQERIRGYLAGLKQARH